MKRSIVQTGAGKILISIIMLVFAIAFAGCGQVECPEWQILVLYAFEAEGELLAGEMVIDSSLTVMGHPVRFGTLRDKPVVLAECGVGMTNAAMTTQRYLDEYYINRLVFSGIAGAIDSSVNIGDITVCSEWATHDYGYIGAEGFLFNSITAYNGQTGLTEDYIYFPVDSAMFRAAQEISADDFGFTLIAERKPKLIIGGAGVSGNTFIDNVERRVWLSETFSAKVVDMESAAVAQVCLANNVPFIIFRSASDLAGGSESGSAEAEINQFFQVAADNSSKVVLKFLEDL
jgi:adenosylhomocysteine nucleosidase